MRGRLCVLCVCVLCSFLCVLVTAQDTREIELTSYAELVLAPPAADAAHPAFSNLFVQTEFIPALNAVLA